MALFNKSDKQTDYSSNVTTIAAGSHVTGKIDIQCELHIDGEVDAEIHSTGTVKIGKSGVVKSNLIAKTLIVSGKFQGEADCETIELVAGGEAEGKLTSSTLTIDSTSAFQGESVRKDAEDKVVSITNEKDSLEKALSDGAKD